MIKLLDPSPKYQRIQRAIGSVILRWSDVEHKFDNLLWLYLSDDYKVARIVSSSLTAQAKADILFRLVEELEKNKKVAGHIKHAIRCYNICRENRNLIAHSHVFEIKKGKNTLIKRSKSTPKNWIPYDAKISVLVGASADMMMTSIFIYTIWDHVRRRDIDFKALHVSLVRKCPLPKPLKQLPIEFIPDDRRPA